MQAKWIKICWIIDGQIGLLLTGMQMGFTRVACRKAVVKGEKNVGENSRNDYFTIEKIEKPRNHWN